MADLVVESLGVRLGGNDILRDVGFRAAPGEIVALLGPSGSGKTTLLRAVAGLERPARGRIAVGERALFDAGRGVELPAEARGLGLVFQSYALWPHKTVAENVAYGLRLRGVERSAVGPRVKEALGRLGLGHLGERYPHQLSGGQQQRVAIARALVYEPPVILLDEPLSNLDAKLRDEARAWLKRLIGELGLAALCVTHDQLEAMALADQILLLNGGVIEQAGSPRELYAHPRTLFAAEFMGMNNRIDGRLETVENGRARLRLDEATVLEGVLGGPGRGDPSPGRDASAVIRLEKVRLAHEEGPNRLAMQVRAAMYLGERHELLLERGPLTVRLYVDEPPASERQVVDLPPEALWVY